MTTHPAPARASGVSWFEPLEERLLLSADIQSVLPAYAAGPQYAASALASPALPGPVANLAAAAAAVDSQAPNAPIGVAAGLYPGRVAWVRDPAATSWDGKSNYWWSDRNTNQDAVDWMMSRALRWYSGASSDAAAWDALFRYFNSSRGGGDVGYAAGEKIAIKINQNSQGSQTEASNEVDTSPQALLSLVRQLVYQANVSPGDITIFDASRPIADKIYNPVHREFAGVLFVDNKGGRGRIAVQPDPGAVVHYDGIAGHDTLLPTVVTQAKYLINLANLKKHDIAGITACAKNLFGAIYRTDTKRWSPAALHSYVSTANAAGSYNPLVDLMGDPQLGGKTLLYMIDGLYGAMSQANVTPSRWQSAPFDNGWTASLLVSQDPVAIDSVAADMLNAELAARGSALPATTDNYLHEAATADQPRAWGSYDPANLGQGLASLGVHEHWNNPADKQYSRNLGLGSGIELVIANPSAAQDDSAATDAGTSVTIDVLANDGPEVLSITDFSQGDHGSVSEVGGQLDYSPQADFAGEDRFSYTVSDGSDSFTATVNVIVGSHLVLPAGQSAWFHDSAGRRWTATLKGAGWADLMFTHARLGDLSRIVLNGTTAKTTLSITPADPHWRTTIHDLQSAGPLGSLTARNVTFDGEVSIAGALGSAAIDAIGGGTWSAGSIGRLSANSITGLTMDLTQGPDPRTAALGGLSISGWFRYSTVSSAGNVGSVSAGGMDGVDLFAGFAGVVLPSSALEFSADCLVRSVTIKGVRQAGKYVDSFIDSNIAARYLGGISVAYAHSTGGIMGLAADAISRLTIRDGTGTHTWTNLFDPGQSKTFDDWIVRVV